MTCQCRPGRADDSALHDYRGYMGRVESGEIAVGDAVTILPAGRTTRVADIQLGGQSRPLAIADQSVTLLLEDDIDISRGDMIVKAGALPQVRNVIDEATNDTVGTGMIV
jgi:sulfate adenylyltransferase subunit 1